MEARFPHCDPLVLHAPNTCVFCDRYPVEQAARSQEGVPFTGEGADPASEQRPLEVIYRWGGNVPWTDEMLEERSKQWAKMFRDYPSNPLE